MDESHGHNVERDKSDTKDDVLRDSIYIKYKMVNINLYVRIRKGLPFWVVIERGIRVHPTGNILKYSVSLEGSCKAVFTS